MTRRPDAFAVVVLLLVAPLLSLFVAPVLTIPALSLVDADAERDDRVPLSAAVVVDANIGAALAFGLGRVAVILPPAIAFLVLSNAYPRDVAFALTPGALAAGALTVLASPFVHVISLHYYREAKRRSDYSAPANRSGSS